MLFLLLALPLCAGRASAEQRLPDCAALGKQFLKNWAKAGGTPAQSWSMDGAAMFWRIRSRRTCMRAFHKLQFGRAG